MSKVSIIGTHNIDHSTFGGIIYLSDYYTNYNGTDTKGASTIVTRIIDDQRFDHQCKINAENREKYKKRK